MHANADCIKDTNFKVHVTSAARVSCSMTCNGVRQKQDLNTSLNPFSTPINSPYQRRINFPGYIVKMMEYFSSKRTRSKSPAPRTQVETPILNEEDEAFLARIETEGTPPELPERPAPPLPSRTQDLPHVGETEGNNAQIALMDGSQNVPLPDTPDDIVTTAEPDDTNQGNAKGKQKEAKKSKWSFLRRDSRDVNRKNKEATATDLMSAAKGLKLADAQPNEDHTVSDPEAKKEEEEMTSILEQLNLAAVNNRVFSVSKESQELLRKYVLALTSCPVPWIQLMAILQIHLSPQRPYKWRTYGLW